ncbi:MAG: site-specific integrase [Candidatus Aminicenantes bacterium]|nr:site-specific integrase [Candidatus Aminicenantes bacterium]
MAEQPVAAAVKRKRGRPAGTKITRDRFLTDDELTRFMKAASKEPEDANLLMSLTYYYGLRVTEAVTLEWSDVNLLAHQITIRALKGGTTRAYALPDVLDKALARRFKRRTVSPWLFPARRRRDKAAHISAQKAKGLFKRIAAKAGIGAHSIHDLRHTCAMQRAASGDTITALASWLRHRRTETSMQYLTVAADAKHEAALAPVVGRFLQL